MTFKTTPSQPTGQRAIIVGASSGIGAALARKLAQEGYHLALLARREERLMRVCDEINRESGEQRAIYFVHDVTDYQAIPALFQEITTALGGLDLFIYNSAILIPIRSDEFDFEKDRQVMETNLLGAMAWLNRAADHFQDLGRGKIVGISSVGGERGRTGAPAYNTSKAGLNTYLEALRNRLSRRGVHVLTVKPGFIATEMLSGGVWVAPVETAIHDIWMAIRSRKQEVYTPARWRWVALFMRNMPSAYWRQSNL